MVVGAPDGGRKIVGLEEAGSGARDGVRSSARAPTGASARRRVWWLSGASILLATAGWVGLVRLGTGGSGAITPIQVTLLDAPELASIRDWDAATADARRDAALAVGRAAIDFQFEKVQVFSEAGVSHEVALFVHVPTKLQFVLVPAGRFVRAFPSWMTDRPTVEVEVKQPFLLCADELRWRDWNLVMGDDHEDTSALAYDLSSAEALAFCARAGLELPTNRQWEFACRLGRSRELSIGRPRMPIIRLDEFSVSGTRDAMGLAGMLTGVSEWSWYDLDKLGRDPGSSRGGGDRSAKSQRRLVHSLYGPGGCSGIGFGEPPSALKQLSTGEPGYLGLRPARNIELIGSSD